jgi:3-isopropylmalate/(R)-2-methylmalate dehydratase small subunit
MSGPARFSRRVGRVARLPVDDVDTDQIIPAAFLKTTGRDGLGAGLFSSWREDPSFVLNRPEAAGARFLLAGHNFGCGSSREHAAWALLDYGFEAVLSSGFSDIFRSNALKNGLLAAEIDASFAGQLNSLVEREPALEITLDLERTAVLLPGGRSEPFRVDAFARHCLLSGIDQLGYLEQQRAATRSFESGHVCWVDTSRVGPVEPAGS